MKEEELIERLSQAEAILDVAANFFCKLANVKEAFVLDLAQVEGLHLLLHDFEKRYPKPMERAEKRSKRITDFLTERGGS